MTPWTSWIAGVALAVLVAGCGGSADPSADPLRAGRTVYGDVCSVCHGSTGQGGAGPALAGVAETFPACADQIRWVTIGSDRWQAEVGATYGAPGKPVKGGMPENGKRLEPDQIAAVVVYERVRHGGLDEAAVIADCLPAAE